MSTQNGGIFPEVGERLKEERKRLRLSQEALCEILGIRDPKTLRSWEGGSTAPDLFDLLTLYRRGFDVSYLVTGQRVPAMVADAARAQYLTPAQRAAGEISSLALNLDDSELLLAMAKRLGSTEGRVARRGSSATRTDMDIPATADNAGQPHDFSRNDRRGSHGDRRRKD